MSARRSCPKRPRERGQAAVELLFVILILVLLTFGAISLAQGVSLKQALDNGADVAARTLSLDPGQWTYAANIIQQHVDENTLGLRPTARIRVYDDTGRALSATSLASLEFGKAFVVEATAPFTFDVPFLPQATYTIRVRHWGIVERYP